MNDSRAYHQLWRVTDGAVRDCFNQHPDYLTNKGRDRARRSVVKRVTGAVIGFSVQAAKSRSGEIPAAETVAVVAAYDDGHIQGAQHPEEQGEVSHCASPDAWRIPGHRVQRAIEKTMARYSERNTKGQFRHLKTPREIMLEVLRQDYAPKLPEPILTAEEVSALMAPPQVEPRLDDVPLDAVEGESRRQKRTGARRESGETNWRATGDSVLFLVPETDAETVPHPAFTPQRLTNSIFAVLLIALMFVDPILIIKIGAGLYGLANSLVAWEGK